MNFLDFMNPIDYILPGLIAAGAVFAMAIELPFLADCRDRRVAGTEFRKGSIAAKAH